MNITHYNIRLILNIIIIYNYTNYNSNYTTNYNSRLLHKNNVSPLVLFVC